VKPFAERCHEEMTRDVIFLLQIRRRCYHTLPDGIEMVEGAFVGRGGTEYPIEHILRLSTPGQDYVEWWDTESVWLDRETAEAYGEAHAYNYPDGWRVYGVYAKGALAKLIQGT